MELDMVADMEVDKVAGLTSTLRPTIGIDIDIDIHININMEIQFGERVGHVGWFIGPKLFRLEAFPYSSTLSLSWVKATKEWEKWLKCWRDQTKEN